MEEGSKKTLARFTDDGGFKPNQHERERFRTVAAFFVFGALMYASYSLVIAGAQDILAGTFIQTSMVLVADIAVLCCFINRPLLHAKNTVFCPHHDSFLVWN